MYCYIIYFCIIFAETAETAETIETAFQADDDSETEKSGMCAY